MGSVVTLLAIWEGDTKRRISFDRECDQIWTINEHLPLLWPAKELQKARPQERSGCLKTTRKQLKKHPQLFIRTQISLFVSAYQHGYQR